MQFLCATLQNCKNIKGRCKTQIGSVQDLDNWLILPIQGFTHFLDFFGRLFSSLTESTLLLSDTQLAPLSRLDLAVSASSQLSPGPASSSVSLSVCSWLLPNRFCSSLAEAERRLPNVSAFLTVLSDMFLQEQSYWCCSDIHLVVWYLFRLSACVSEVVWYLLLWCPGPLLLPTVSRLWLLPCWRWKDDTFTYFLLCITRCKYENDIPTINTCLLRMLERSPFPSWLVDRLLSRLAMLRSRLTRAWLSSSMSDSRPLLWLLYWPGPLYHTTTWRMAWY